MGDSDPGNRVDTTRQAQSLFEIPNHSNFVFSDKRDLLFFGGMFLYVAGAFAVLATIGISGDASLSTTTGMIGIVAFIVLMLIVVIIILIVPLFHIMGQWAGYRVLKGDNYRYPVIGKLVEKRLLQSSMASEIPLEHN